MLPLDAMLLRLAAAVVLGAVVGLERELIGKEAGIRTNIMVAAGAALFAIVGVMLPYLIALSPESISDITIHNGGFLAILGNIVVGVGFLGAGIIVKDGVRVRGLTTAATVWFTAAIGILCGIGLFELAAVSAVGVSLLLFILRKMHMHRLPEGTDDTE